MCKRSACPSGTFIYGCRHFALTTNGTHRRTHAIPQEDAQRRDADESKIVEEYAERLAERMLERHRKEIEAEAEAKAEALAEAEVRKVREAHKKSFLDSIASLMKTMGLTAEQAMDALSIPAENQAYLPGGPQGAGSVGDRGAYLA